MKNLAFVCLLVLKENLVNRFVLTLIASFTLISSYAATITSTGAGGSWTSGATWVGGVVPGTNDDVVIATGATVTVPSSQTCRLLTVNGTLNMNNTGITLFITNNSTSTLGLTLGAGSSLFIGSNNTLDFSTTQSTGIQNNGGTIVSTGINGSDGGTIVSHSSSGGGFEIAGTATVVNNLQFIANATFYISGTSLFVNGTFTIPENNWNFNGSSKSPIYGPASTLYIDKNNQGYTQGKEWSANSGTIGVTPGYPNNVVLVDMGSSSGGTGGTGWVPSGAVGLNGSLRAGDGTQNGRISLENVTSFNSGGIIVDNNSLIVGPAIPFIDRGNFTLQGATTGIFQNMTGGVINFAGSGTSGSPQTISTTGSSVSFSEMIVSNGTYVRLNDPVSVTQTLTLTSGYVGTTTTNLLSITNTNAATGVSGGSAASYVDGPLGWSVPAATSGNYRFPIGDLANGNAYLPLTLTPNTTSGALVTATAFNVNSNGTHDATVTTISPTEYWSVTTSSPFTSGPLVTVQRPSAVSPNNALAVAPASGGVYTAIGGTPNGGAPGSISGGGIGTGSPAFITMVIAPLSVVKLSSTNYACSGTTGSLTVGGSGGTPSYTFEIDGGGFGNTTGYFPNLAAGDHIVRVRDAATTIAQATFKILGSVVINGDNKDIIICPTPTTRLTATNLQNTTPSFSWSDDPSGVPVLQSGAQNFYDANTSTNMVSKTYYVTSDLYNTNLLTNGNFESGNTGFTSSYQFYPNPPNATYGTTPGNNGYYSITSQGKTQCQYFTIAPAGAGPSLGQQNGGNAYFVGDGATASSMAWQSNAIGSLIIGKLYKFQFWYAAADPDATHAQLRTSVDGGIGNLGTVTATDASAWTQATYSFTATATTHTITITNLTATGSTNGNDFYLDNMELLSPCTVKSSINVIVNCSLPVEFTDFNAVRKGAGALLTWGTASELNSSHFIIEKSVDGISFSSIGRVEAARNSSSLIRYDFTDPSIANGITYYRLAEYDADGTLQYSPVRAVHKDGGVGEVEVIPNPNNGTFVVTVNNIGEAKSRILVLNVLGQVVYEQGESTAHYRNVDISNLPAGTYYLQVSTAVDTIGKKIVKE